MCYRSKWIWWLFFWSKLISSYIVEISMAVIYRLLSPFWICFNSLAPFTFIFPFVSVYLAIIEPLKYSFITRRDDSISFKDISNWVQKRINHCIPLVGTDTQWPLAFLMNLLSVSIKTKCQHKGNIECNNTGPSTLDVLVRKKSFRIRRILYSVSM